MLIRNGWVSNSSSSSFVVIYSSKDDFKGISLIEGYRFLMHDLDEDIGADAAVSIFSGLLEDTLYRVFFQLCDGNYNPAEDRDDIELNKLAWDLDVDYTPYNSLVTELYTRSLLYAESKDKSEYRKWYKDEFINKASVVIEELAKKLVEAVTTSGRKVGCVEYCDHNKVGDYMEHHFMPWIANNPDRTYAIIRHNGH